MLRQQPLGCHGNAAAASKQALCQRAAGGRRSYWWTMVEPSARRQGRLIAIDGCYGCRSSSSSCCDWYTQHSITVTSHASLDAHADDGATGSFYSSSPRVTLPLVVALTVNIYEHVVFRTEDVFKMRSRH